MSKRQRQYQRYNIETTTQAEKDLKEAGIPKRDVGRIRGRIDALEANPRPHGYIKLRDTDDLYRIRSGDYRIIYQISDDPAMVTITNIGHRRDIY